MSRFSFRRTKYLSSGGLEVVPAEGLEVAFCSPGSDSKPLPEAPQNLNVKDSIYVRILHKLSNSATWLPEQLWSERQSTWKTNVLGIQPVWLLVGLCIFVLGVGVGGFFAAAVVSGTRGSQGSSTTPSTESSFLDSSVTGAAVMTSSQIIAYSTQSSSSSPSSFVTSMSRLQVPVSTTTKSGTVIVVLATTA